jgi:ABC-type transport system involved in Fe-S cluster assembly fused permease/ATPase subunit
LREVPGSIPGQTLSFAFLAPESQGIILFGIGNVFSLQNDVVLSKVWCVVRFQACLCRVAAVTLALFTFGTLCVNSKEMMLRQQMHRLDRVSLFPTEERRD